MLCLRFVVLIFGISGTGSFRWTDSLGNDQVKCVSEAGILELPWNLQTDSREELAVVKWYYRGSSEELIALMFNGTFLALPAFSSRVTYIPPVGIRLARLVTGDQGIYTVEVQAHVGSDGFSTDSRSVNVFIGRTSSLCTNTQPTTTTTTTSISTATADVPTVTGNFTDVTTVHLHQPLTLHCDISDPHATVTWQRTDGKAMSPRVTVHGNDIIFTSISKADEGVYECGANTILGKVQKAVDLRLFDISPYDCDFEEDFCSWTNSVHDDKFDWLRNHGTTPTAGTGPSVDHTLATQEGHYAYIETSSPRSNGDNARLESRILNPQQDYCLSFWYHMYGSSLNNVNIRLSSNGITGNPVWRTTGPSEDKWKLVTYTVHAQTTPFRIVIEGVSGPGYQGDAAIDDITVSEGGCS